VARARERVTVVVVDGGPAPTGEEGLAGGRDEVEARPRRRWRLFRKGGTG